MKQTGYEISAPDNDSYMFGYDNKYELGKCKSCNKKDNYDFLNLDFDLKIKKYDLSYTYDGYLIASEKFKKFCELNNYSAITFHKLTKHHDRYAMLVNNVKPFDIVKKRLQYADYCDTCKKFDEVFDCFPVVLIEGNELDDNFYRTDLIFGWRNNQSPVIMCGQTTFNKIKVQKFKGFEYRKMH